MSLLSSIFFDETSRKYAVLVTLLISWIFSSRENENVAIKTFLRKIYVVCESGLFMLYSKDSKGVGPKYNTDAENIHKYTSISKTIIFVRHGESDWNNVFNKGINLSIFVRLAKALWSELLLLFRMDSVFLDSPLNEDGIEQALELRKFLQSAGMKPNDPLKEICAIIRGEIGSSVIVSSTLRRAISTTVLSLWPRFENTEESIHLLSSLQEISRNVDTRSLSTPGTVADLPFHRVTSHCPGLESRIEEVFDATSNTGNKTRKFYGIKRLRSFADWCFGRPETTIIVGGHSLWFKYFFQVCQYSFF